MHLMAAEGASGSGGSQSLDSGDMWRYGCPKSPDWDSDGESWSESGGLSSSDLSGHNVASLALHVIGQNWSGEKLSLFLVDWELVRVALTCHVALDMLCQEVHEAWWLGCRCQGSLLSQQAKAFRRGERNKTKEGV